ncbi:MULTISPECIES: hypothetical protein [Delftia]|uniref:hypothetical protein n=1 Tax=Delftia TaxID=80865 RepID=UPI00241FF442|nr:MULTISPECIES: hypothetical protein [Delftia]MCP4014915.1 hypothetical protein [Delftia sp.]MCP4516986.1 hypothetical protein [Delftia sp.]
MVNKNPVTLAIDALKFDEFGIYAVTEVLTDDELDFINGGALQSLNIICPNAICPQNRQNSICGEDNDFNI